MVDAIVRELKTRTGFLEGNRIQTLYFGGGTPSILTTNQINEIVKAVHEHFDTSELRELTLECNPDDVSKRNLESWVEVGVNRLSLGIQSFRDEDLKLMNRAHSSSEASDSLRLIKEAGITNITADLIYGLPNLSIEDWKKNIHLLLEHDVPHVSAYCLTFEEKTVFDHWRQSGKIKEVGEELQSDQFQVLIKELAKAGIHQYEVSNFARPGYESIHNSAYWSGQPYLGVGPSAHSYWPGTRSWNIDNNAQYMKLIEGGDQHWEEEELSSETSYNEMVLTGLRTRKGLDLNAIKHQTGYSPEEEFQDYVANLISRKLAELENSHLKLSSKGLLQADRIASDLFIIES